MSIEPKSLGLHEFLRYALPGYIYLFVFLLPIFLTDFPFPIKLSGSLVQSLLTTAVLVIAGPTIGYLVFYMYYPVFKHFSYNFKNIPPFQMMETYVSAKLNRARAELWPSLSRYQKEMLVRAMEDVAVHSGSSLNESAHARDPNLRVLRERVEFLFSSFHSLGATVTAIWLGIISWIVAGAVNSLVSCELIFRIPKNVLITYTFLAFLWVGVSVMLLFSFRHRKNLGITEEYLFALIHRGRIDDLIDDFAEEPEHFTEWDMDSRKRIVILPIVLVSGIVLFLLAARALCAH